MSGEDPILPLINRRAPLLERIRDGNADNSVGEDLAVVVSDSVKSDDEEFLQELEESIQTTLNESLADNLGVESSEISNGYTGELASLITNVDEETVLTEDALKSLGIKASDDTTEEDQEDTEDSSLFD